MTSASRHATATQEAATSPATPHGQHTTGAADHIARLITRAVGIEVPVRLRAWDGSASGPADAPLTVHVRSPQALRRLVWEPSELGATRGYVAGEIDVELPDGQGLDEVLADSRLATFAAAARRAPARRLHLAVELVRAATRMRALGPPLPAPDEESRLVGRRHGRRRDAAAISHHYDVGNEFYRLLLGESLVYSCGYWRAEPHPGYTVDQAQRDKLALVCGKLGLAPGQRLLDVGCGWGSLVIHAAQRHEAHAVGITLSAEQAAVARERVDEAGLSDLVQIRLQDYREIEDGPYDAIASVGMAEHVGVENFPVYAEQMRRLLVPGGRLLHHQITSAHPADRSDHRRFINRYIFPDGELLPVGDVIGYLERAGFEPSDVEGLREHYVLTLHAWLNNLEQGWEDACTLTSTARARAWRLYLAGSAAAFSTGRIGVHQVLAVAPLPDGQSPLPRLRSDWLPDQPGHAISWFGDPS